MPNGAQELLEEGSPRPHWQVVVGTLGALVPVAAVFVVIVMQFSSMSSTISSQSQDIALLKTQVQAVDNRERLQASDLVSIKMALREIETQFRASDDMANLQHAHDQRDFAVLWLKVYGTSYPLDNSYYPHVGQPSNGMDGHP
jgi:hypothetical protein